MKRIPKTYRINEYLVNELEDIREILGVNSTSMIEIALIEKFSKMGTIGKFKDYDVECVNKLIKELEEAREKIGND